jgi:hypothetical protein
MALVDAVITAVVSLLVGGLGVYVAANVVASEPSYEHAVWTAGIAAVVWALTGWLFGDIAGVGPLITLLAWVGVIKWRYAVGWVGAAAIGVLAWAAAGVVLWALSRVGVVGIEATGIPNV